MITQIRDFDDRIDHLHDRLTAWHRANEVSRRLATIPGIGPVTASLISASVTDAAQFRSGRHFAAWIGLVLDRRATAARWDQQERQSADAASFNCRRSRSLALDAPRPWDAIRLADRPYGTTAPQYRSGCDRE